MGTAAALRPVCLRGISLPARARLDIDAIYAIVKDRFNLRRIAVTAHGNWEHDETRTFVFTRRHWRNRFGLVARLCRRVSIYYLGIRAVRMGHPHRHLYHLAIVACCSGRRPYLHRHAHTLASCIVSLWTDRALRHSGIAGMGGGHFCAKPFIGAWYDAHAGSRLFPFSRFLGQFGRRAVVVRLGPR